MWSDAHVLHPIYAEVSKVMGRDFPYPRHLEVREVSSDRPGSLVSPGRRDPGETEF